MIGRILVCLLLSGCAPSPWKQLSKGVPTEDLLRSQTAAAEDLRLHPPPPERMPDAASAAAPARLFARLPNPTFTLYFSARLSEDSVIPPYHTRFHLYAPPSPWALPGEAPPHCTGCANP